MKAKNIIVLMIMSISLFAVSCSESANSEISIEERLKKLESERADLDTKIADLRLQLGTVEKTVPVEVMDLNKNPFSHYTSVYGEVQSDQDVNMNPKAMGVVSNVSVQEGQRVSKGQLLAQIDNQMVLKRLKEAKDSYEFIKTVFEKQKGVWEKNVGSEVDFLKAKNDKESMENRIAILNEELSNMRITAPFSGVIDKIYIKEGETASPSAPAFHLVSESNLKVKTDISEAVARKLKKGDKANIIFPDLEIDTLNLTISAISQSIDRVNRTVSIYVDLPKSVYSKVKPAMLATVKFKTAEIEDAITLPTNLIQQEGTTEYVLVASKNKNQKLEAAKKIIVKGKTYNGVTEIIGGLKLDDKIISVGYENVREGDLIKTSQQK
ncbi:MAG: efflux RND transporter periplasmic adaptor subunit [Candidatus Kapaibacterium sp.]